MAQQHLDRLTALDAGFLHQERDCAHMHVGGLAVFAGPPPAQEVLLDHLRGRLHLVPRYRQRLATPPLDSGRPLWVDDAAFDLRRHVHRVTLAAPGTHAQLEERTASILSSRLDRMRPLWELWVIDGLDTGGFALLSKTHHALIDGIAGVDLATVMFDLGPTPMAVPHPDEPWRPQPEPSPAELLAGTTVHVAKTAAGALARGLLAAVRPATAAAGARDVAEGLGEIVRAALQPAPPTPLNVPIGPDRRFVGVRRRLEDLKVVKDVFGGTVNDVVLTVVTGALREWLQTRDVDTDGLELRALVPVSIRDASERNQLNNRITVMRGALPVWIGDPIARHRAVRAAMDGLKESKQAVGAEALTNLENFAPPTLLAQASRLNFSTRFFNLLVTNVPGPQFPLYVEGRELQEIFPLAFLPRDHALAIGIMSYNGGMNFGVLGDRDALPDIDVVAGGIGDALDELVALARARDPR